MSHNKFQETIFPEAVTSGNPTEYLLKHVPEVTRLLSVPEIKSFELANALMVDELTTVLRLDVVAPGLIRHTKKKLIDSGVVTRNQLSPYSATKEE